MTAHLTRTARLASIAAALSLWVSSWCEPVRAQQMAPVDLVISPLAARGVDVERARAGLAQELGVRVRVLATPEWGADVTTLVVLLTARGDLLFEIVRPGVRKTRALGVPGDREQRADGLVEVAASMLRQDAREKARERTE